MNYDALSNNDDDLFSDNSSDNTNQTFTSDSGIDNLLNSLDINLEEVDSMLFRARIVTTLIDTANKFVYETNSYNRTIFNTLNSLTDGQFQYTLYAETLEEGIYRRLLVLDFLKSCTDEMDEKILALISKATSSNLDSRFINTYIVSMKNILEYSIDYNISIYNKICEQINRSPISFDIDNNFDLMHTYINPTSYINSVFTNIKKSLGFGIKLESD